ncbi:hypothetical protein [Arenibaculum pallidiluteum]|uniref:hypothetical protein n=1 Tax=Arenibaculum pallidiluteum TaxID=2812559 RepID=UPI001A979E5B|nr:hypothetical protein [Arenibaculum pallidiluteum]
MSMVPAAARLQVATLTHVGLLERFIELTQAELDRAEDSFTRESLAEMIEAMRTDLRGHTMLMSRIPAAEMACA